MATVSRPNTTGEPVVEPYSNSIEELAAAASEFQLQLTGRAPKAVTVVLSEETLVVTLHEALSPAERAFASSPAGASQVQEFHRQLFEASVAEFCSEIKRIIGREVRESAAEFEPATGAVIHAFTTGTMVEVFLLAPSGADGADRGSTAVSDLIQEP